jgi:uncharacterized protein YggT (Ycf19 family)
MATTNKEVPMYLNISKVMAYVMYAWVMIGVITLGLRVFLLALSANTDVPFVRFIYNTSADYLTPFRGIFPSKEFGATGYLDVAAIFAVIIYLFVGWGFSALITFLQSKVDSTQTPRSY